MRTLHLSVDQVADMDLVQIYAVVESYQQMQGTQAKLLSIAEPEELMGNA